MAEFKEVFEKHGEQLKEIDEGVGEKFDNLSNKLSELGYDVLINDKQKAEFVPSNRLSEVVNQRDQFKNQIDTLNQQLEELKGNDNSEEVNQRLQETIDQNNELSKQLEDTKVNTELMLLADDAWDAKDILPFVDRSKIKVNTKGEIKGADEEVERIRTEKPHLFGKPNKGGQDNAGGKNSNQIDMNTLIRNHAGRL